MNPNDTVEYSSLNWVKKELDLVLDEAQKAFNIYIEDISETEKLQECIDQIHLIHGTLLMVELYGAAMLAEEIEALLKSLINSDVSGNEEIYQLVMGAMLRLPDYLDGLVSGNKDIPIVLLPVLNDLRAARNEALLSENLLFFPDIDIEDVEEIDVVGAGGDELQALAKRLRPHFQLGLLTWFKDEKPLSGLKRIQAVINELEKHSSEKKIRRLWTVSSALLESLIHKGINSSISIKLLIGKIDRLNKELIDKGEQALAKSLPSDVVKNLLYYIARSDSLGERVTNIKEVYQLNELLPANNAENEAALSMGGPNIDLLQTVSQAIREDFTEVKDALEVFVHGDDQGVAKLEPLPTLLAKIADTMGMLSLGEPRQLIVEQKAQVEKFIAGEATADDAAVMDVASVLLAAEAQLNNFIASKSTRVITGSTSEEQDSGYQEVLASVAKEALKDFGQAKQLIILYADSPIDSSNLDQVISLFTTSGAALFMAPLDILSPLIRGIAEYIEVVIKGAGQIIPEQMDVAADAITSIEYYLESVIEGRKDLEADLNFGRSAVEKLRKFTETARSSSSDTNIEATAPAPLELETAEQDISLDNDDELGFDLDTSSDVLDEITLDGDENFANDLDVSAEDLAYEESLIDDVSEPVVELEEIEVTQPKAVKQTAATKTEREPLPVISDDIDEEIFEIFIEEALEVLGEINNSLPLWKADHNNDEARTTLRRSFHTLKGSGRLIGAMMIGEFAWSIENMINRVIDNSIALNNEVFGIVDEAAAVLPQLIEQMQGDSQPVSNIYDLMDHADALSRGETYLPPAETEAAEPAVSADVEDDQQSQLADAFDETEAGDSLSLESDMGFDVVEDLEEETASTDVGFDFDESILEDSEELEFGASDIDLMDEDIISFESPDDISLEVEEASMFDVDDSDEIELQSVDGAFDIAADLSLDEAAETTNKPSSLSDIPVKVEIDAELFGIFRTEAEGHLNTIRHILIVNQTDKTPVIAEHELIRALHTLYGSARTAEVVEIGSVCGIAEKYVKAKNESGDNEINADGIAALNELVATVTEALNNLEKSLPLSLNQSLIDRFTSLHEQASGELDNVQIQTKNVPDNALTSYGDIDDELVDIFLEEAEELVESAEKSLQQWQEDNTDVDSVNELKRILHTLKGGARMAELTPIGDLTHALETVIIEAAEADPAPLMTAMQDALDTLVSMLAKVSERLPIESAAIMIAELNAARIGKKVSKPSAVIEQDIETELSLEDELALETSFESPDVEDPLDINDFNEEVDIDISMEEESLEVDSEEMIELEELDETLSDSEQNQALETVPAKESLPTKNADGSNVFVLEKINPTEIEDDSKSKAVQEQVRVRAELLNDLVNNAGEVNIYNSRFNQQLTDFGYNLSEFDQTVQRLRDQLRKLEIETETQIFSRHETEASQYDADFDPLEMDRYSTLQQLSRSLMESVSDLESIKDFMGNTVRESETLLQQQSRISTELQESLMRTRMIKFNGLTSRLNRIVRQTARELNKTVEFEIIGDDLEVDRSILDRIVSPLEHLLRNAVSHGIESDEVRASLNKTEAGKVKILITKDGQDLVVTVNDNGGGISVEAIKNKAIANGLMSPDSELSDHDIVQFILEAGFSTAQEVTQISGRGVGLDVVDSEIKQLGGSLDIQSKLNQGTSFIARLPMTLSINQALLVHVHEDIFAVPLNTVEGVVRLSGYELEAVYSKGEGHYEFSGEKYDIKYLGYLLKGKQPEYLEQSVPYPVLLVKSGELRVAIHVDSLLGRREIVVKPVGAQITTVKGISGATILGDGHVVLILDMAALLRAKSVFQIESQAEEMQREAEKAASDVLTVMVVDDSITIRKVTERILLRRGMEVILAKDGLDASAKLQEKLPDIMLLDIEMPRMDGYEVATMVRNNEHMKHLPIIMITSRTGSKHKDKAIEIGVNRYLGKPYQEDELIENITAVMDEIKAS